MPRRSKLPGELARMAYWWCAKRHARGYNFKGADRESDFLLISIPWLSQQHEASSCDRKNSQNVRSNYEEKLKCSPSVFNIWLIKILRRFSSSLARFWLFAWKVALKMLGSPYESVSFEFKDKSACGKPFVVLSKTWHDERGHVENIWLKVKDT